VHSSFYMKGQVRLKKNNIEALLFLFLGHLNPLTLVTFEEIK
jgi:hypothetical protein